MSTQKPTTALLQSFSVQSPLDALEQPAEPQWVSPELATHVWGSEAAANQWNFGAGSSGIKASSVWDEYSGAGVRVAVVDDGFDRLHGEIEHAYNTSLDKDFLSNDTDAAAAVGNNHGTAVMSLISAEHGGTGMRGVASGAETIGVRIGFDSAWNVSANVNAVKYAGSVADVVNMSWGASGAFGDNYDVSSWAPMKAALLDGTALGRGGLGTVFVASAGNGRTSGDNTNHHSMKSDPGAIVVAATDASGNVASFSTAGASILVAAPGVSVLAADMLGANGYVSGDFAMVSGTSFAAPTVAGVVALMLEANPDLGYRDVQEILALTATRTGTNTAWGTNGSVTWNGGGMHVSPDLGFGLVDARAAVRLAEVWEDSQTASNRVLVSATNATKVMIKDNATVASSVAVASTDRLDEVETVQVVLNITHARPSDLEVTLTSPSGTVVTLIARPANGTTSTGIVFETSATAFRGEQENGTWTLRVTDAVTGSTGTLNSWTLKLHGDVPTSDTMYVYTDEYGTTWTTARSVVSDTNGGMDTLMMASLSGNAMVDLNPGVVGTVAGNAFSVAAGSAIERVFMGEGDDWVVGNALANMLHGGHGNDSLFGGIGNDMLVGSRGHDVLVGGEGQDVFTYGHKLDGGDAVVDFSVVQGDKVDPGPLLISLGWTGSVAAAVAAGWFALEAVSGGMRLVLTQPGHASVTLALLEGVSSLTLADVFGLHEEGGGVAGASSALTITEAQAAGWGAGAVWGAQGTVYQLLDMSAALKAVSVDLSTGRLVVNAKTAMAALYVVVDEVQGGLGNDTLLGSVRDDDLSGNAGNDSLRGGAGNEELFGGFGDDKIYGDAGVDVAEGGDGNDAIYGGDGNDALYGGAGNDATYGGAGNDELFGGFGDDRLYGEAGDEVAEGGDGNDAIYGGDGNDTLYGGADNDVIYGDAGEDALFGGLGNDKLYGGIGNDTLGGFDGNDTMLGGAGNDGLLGGTGNDSLSGEDGDDTLDSGEGDDKLFGGNGNDVLRGDAGNDSLDGGAGNDLLNGGTGLDTLVGGTGNDTVIGGADADRMAGGTGADVFRWASFDDAGDTITDFKRLEGDTLDAGPLLSSLGYTGSDPFGDGWLVARPGSAGAEIWVTPPNGPAVRLVTLIGLSAFDTGLVSGTVGADTVYAIKDGQLAGFTTTKSLLMTDANGGVDTIDASGLSQGATIDLNANAVSILAGGVIKLTAAVVENACGGAGNDAITGNALANRLEGGTGNDTLNGASGNDVLIGESGNDRLTGGAGSDVFVLGARLDGMDTMADFKTLDGDKLDASAWTASFGMTQAQALAQGLFSLRQEGAGSWLVFNAPGEGPIDVARLEGVSGATPVAGLFSGVKAAAVPMLMATDAVMVSAQDGPAEVWNMVSAPSWAEGSGAILVGNLGVASYDLSQVSGPAVLNLGMSTAGTLARKTIGFQASVESLRTGLGSDRITGSSASERLDVGGGDDTVAAGAGNDEVWGGLGNDSLGGGLGDDSLWGGVDNDKLLGEIGNDMLWGEDGADTLDGGAGNDLLNGGAGLDRMTGGAGADVFVFALRGDMGDTITDFKRTEGDSLDVDDLLADLGLGSASEALADGDMRLSSVSGGSWLELQAEDGWVRAAFLQKLDATVLLDDAWFA